jgi:hypothetical protein
MSANATLPRWKKASAAMGKIVKGKCKSDGLSHGRKNRKNNNNRSERFILVKPGLMWGPFYFSQFERIGAPPSPPRLILRRQG